MWDDSSERHLLFRHAEGRKEGMYLLPTAINLVYALQQGYDFVHFQVSYALRRFHSVTGPSRHVLYTLYVQWQCVSVRA